MSAVRKGLLLAGAGLAVIACVVGFVPITAGGADCGTVFLRQDWLAIALSEGEAAADDCEQLLSVLAIPVWVLLGLAALLMVGAGLVKADRGAPVRQ